MRTPKAKKTKKRKIESPEDKEKRIYRNEIRSIFKKVGFTFVPEVYDTEFTYKGRTGDIDDVFIFENIIVLIERTFSKVSKNITEHLLKKKVLFDKILENTPDFIQFFCSTFESFANILGKYYNPQLCHVIILYCSRYDISIVHKKLVPDIKYLDYPILKYFSNLSSAIKISTQYEIFKFFNLDYEDIGKNHFAHQQSYKFQGTVLPEAYSNFEEGYKVVSFYIAPMVLLSNSFVLRKDSWEDGGDLYQRMIDKKKIASIRKYLNDQMRVFINNVILTLPDTTKILNNDGNTIDIKTITTPTPVNITIPNEFNTIGIIDGQHRVYAYHEGGLYENVISELRMKQNLLATGIIYPEAVDRGIKTRFEAKLFLEINSNQTNAKTELKQAIELILNPYLSSSIGLAIIKQLNNEGPFESKFESPYFKEDKVKITSIVSYGLKPIVKLSGYDSFYYIWDSPNKSIISKNKNLLDTYIQFCISKLNEYFSAVKQTSNHLWTTDKNEKNRILTTSSINGLIICLRKLILTNKHGDREYYLQKFKHLKDFEFSKYKSSQYNKLAEKLLEIFFTD